MASKKLNPIELEQIRQSLTPKTEAPELYVPEVISTSDIKKKKLLEMAARGEKLPGTTSKDHEMKKLGVAFRDYTRSDSNSFDRSFTESIKTMMPDWFLSTSDIKKEELLKMAIRGDKKPTVTSKDSKIKKLGVALGAYSKKNSGSFDQEFVEKIKEHRPDWYENTAKAKKEKLLEMAALGDKKPSRHSSDCELSSLGRAFSSYTNPNSPVFDLKFKRKISRIRSSWLN